MTSYELECLTFKEFKGRHIRHDIWRHGRASLFFTSCMQKHSLLPLIEFCFEICMSYQKTQKFCPLDEKNLCTKMRRESISAKRLNFEKWGCRKINHLVSDWVLPHVVVNPRVRARVFLGHCDIYVEAFSYTPTDLSKILSCPYTPCKSKLQITHRKLEYAEAWVSVLKSVQTQAGHSLWE